MKISARNIFQGTISSIVPGSVNSEIDITLGGNDKVIAIVTNGSVTTLGLTVGKAVTAFIKASSILVMTDSTGIALSARNVLAGKISKVSNGQVSSEIGITLPSGITVFATITHASAVFKASSVILGVPK
jgi:molybdate transport system regulatory protein